jgi:hypothetical protein
VRRFAAGTIALLIAAGTAGGCSVPGDTARPSASPLATVIAQPSASASPPSPSPVPSLPALPASLPVMPGAEAVDPATIEPGIIARWTIAEIGPRVYEYYLDALPDAGFAIEGQFPGGNVAIIRFTAPDGTALDLSLVGEGEGGRQTRIDLVPSHGL